MKNDEKKFEQLTELLRRAGELLYPFSEQEDIAHFQKKDIRDRLYGKYPKCFLAIKGKGREIPFFPICNRMGMHDPKLMAFSKKLVTRMRETGKFDDENLAEVERKLDMLYSKYTKDTIKPSVEAAKKGLQTKLFNNIKKYLEDTK